MTGRVLPHDRSRADVRAILRLSSLLRFRQVRGIKNVVNTFISRISEDRLAIPSALGM